MRIVHVLNQSFRGNGHVAVAVDLACAQARNGHEVVLASAPGDFADVLAAHGVRFYDLDIQSRSPANVLRVVGRFDTLLKDFKPDIVHAHMVAAAVVGRICKLRHKFRLVTTIHNSFDKQAILMGVGDNVVAVSEAVRAQMEKRGIARRKLSVVLNGTIGGGRRPPMPATLPELAHPAVITVAGLHPRKGVADLISGFNQCADKFPSAHLYIVGNGPSREDLETQAKALPSASRIIFLGFQDDPRPFLRSADIFVLASHAEPYGLVISEAREAGCAIVGTSVGGIPENLKQGNIGILVPPRDPSAISGALSRLMSDPKEMAAYRAAANENLTELTVDRMNADYEAIYAAHDRR